MSNFSFTTSKWSDNESVLNHHSFKLESYHGIYYPFSSNYIDSISCVFSERAALLKQLKGMLK